MSRKSDSEALPESDALFEEAHPRHRYELFGHHKVEQDLLEAYRHNRLPQAIILGGPEGIGKATLAWRFARFVLANPLAASASVQQAQDLSVSADHPVSKRLEAMGHGDLLVLRREWNDKTKKHYTEIRIDDVRQAMNLYHHASSEGGWRICIVDSADDLNISSANALLKIIEEPPPLSLFLFISHRPGRMLPTIRSRSRLIHMEPLDTQDVVAAIKSLGEDWAHHEGLEDAAERSGGSVRQALRLLSREGLELTGEIEELLNRLPDVDWSGLHQLADRVSASDAQDDFAATIEAIQDWLDHQVRSEAAAGAGPASLAPYAQVWEKVADSVREAEAINLDKRPLILSIFADLAAAVSAARP